MPRWRIERMDGVVTQIDASAADIALLRQWLAECNQPVRQIALIAEGITWPVWRSHPGGKWMNDQALLLTRLDVILGLLRGAYEHYYAREAGLEAGESRTFLEAIQTLETAYAAQMARLTQDHTPESNAALKGMN